MTANEWGQIAALVLLPLAVATVIWLVGSALAWRRPLPHQAGIRRWSAAAALSLGGLCFAILILNHLSR